MTEQIKYFYSVLKNEDATPFIGNNLLVVADGLGGAGSTVHDIKLLKEKPLHDEIFQTAYYDFDWDKAQPCKNYFEYLIRPMADGIPDTSALWGSRIAIARCVYALCCSDKFTNADLADGFVRRELADFITDGLEYTVKYFKLEKGKYDDQKLLPTTLAFVKYKKGMNGKILAEAVWAGDSRCYALTVDGLKLLSVDDEDNSGSITNLFHVGGKRPTVLNYRRYELQAPCVLMAVSDGVFDPFEPHDNFGVEYTLLSYISGSNSYEELMETLKEYYGKIHSDDATMAFASLGFDTYDDMQKVFTDRARYVSDMWGKLCDTNCALEVINQPEEDVRKYVETRTSDKFATIIPQLVMAGNDVVYNKTLRSSIERSKEKLLEAAKADKTEKVEKALENLMAYLYGRPEEVKKVINTDIPASVSREFKIVTENLLRDCAFINSLNDSKCAVDIFETEKGRWGKVIAERETFYWQKAESLRGNEALKKERFAALKYLRIWLNIDYSLERCFKPCNTNDLEYSDKQIAKDIDEFIVRSKRFFYETVKTQNDINAVISSYNRSLDKLFTLLKKKPSICAEIFTNETVKGFGLGCVAGDNGSVIEVKAEELVEILSADKDKIVGSIVDSLAQNYGKTSVIDSNYNNTRLNAFREYYRLKANPDKSIGEFEKALEALEKLYESLLR